MVLGDLLFNNLKNNADSVALVQGERSFTYGQCCNLVSSLSDHLRSRGITKGDRVGLYLPNSTELAVSFFAVTEAGGVCVPINHKFRRSEVQTYIEQSGAGYLITNEQLSDEVKGTGPDLKRIIVNGKDADWCMFNEYGPVSRKTPQTGCCDNAIYLFSTGSTGIPKCVARHHANLLALADNHTQTVGWDRGDRVLLVIPLSHTYAFGSFISAVKVGAAIYLMDDFNRKQVCSTLSDERITVFPAVPFMLDVLSAYVPAESTDFSSLKHVISAGAPLDEEVAKKFFETFKIYPRQLYGSSETGVISINMATNIIARGQSVGRPVANVTVKVVDEEGKEKSRGELGEIAVSSPSMASGYLNLDDETKKVFKNGFYYTGDVGLIDEEGYIYIKGRKKLFINVGGLKVDPVEVENALLANEGISEVAVTGGRSERGNEIIVAHVVKEGDIKRSDIVKFCKGRISDFKIPRLIEFVDSLPKSPTGKILRNKLKKE